MDKLSTRPLIVWEKWVDPFGGDLDETKWTDYNNDVYNPDQLLTDQEENLSSKPINNKPIKVIASPLGLIPYNEYTASSKIFNFWIGHTNFNISTTVKNIIEACDGVEILDIFTRYRFRIAIGKCFNDSEVMTYINEQINSLYDKPQN